MKIMPLEYFEYVMQRKDKRFAQNPSLQYFVLNTVERQQCTMFAKGVILLG